MPSFPTRVKSHLLLSERPANLVNGRLRRKPTLSRDNQSFDIHLQCRMDHRYKEWAMIDDKSLILPDSLRVSVSICSRRRRGAFHSVPSEPKSSLGGTGPVLPNPLR